MQAGGNVLNEGKRNLLGIMIDAVDYEAAVAFVIQCAGKTCSDDFCPCRSRHHDRAYSIPSTSFASTASTCLFLTRSAGSLDDELDTRNKPARPRVWARVDAKDMRTGRAKEETPIYLYGSTEAVVTSLAHLLTKRFPGINIVGCEPSAFRKLSGNEKTALQQRIQLLGASIVFAGLGCPRQGNFRLRVTQ